VTKLSNRVLISLWAVPTSTGSVSCRRTFRTDLAFQNQMYLTGLFHKILMKKLRHLRTGNHKGF
jgi:hypothetical protein